MRRSRGERGARGARKDEEHKDHEKHEEHEGKDEDHHEFVSFDHEGVCLMCMRACGHVWRQRAFPGSFSASQSPCSPCSQHDGAW